MIIGVLFAALIGPYLINWTAYRNAFEREATRYFGMPVKVVGKADLRILPTPTITFTDVRLGEPEAPDIVVERFHSVVELAPLMKGEIRVLEMRVERPTMMIDLAALSRAEARPPVATDFDLEKISLSKVEIRQGDATIADSRTGDEWIISGINAVVEARSLLGPASFEGGLVFNGERYDVRAAAGRRTRGNTLPLNFSIAPAAWPVSLTAEGQLMLEPDAQPRYRAAVKFGAREGDAGADAQPEPFGIAALRVAGVAEVTPQALSLEEVLIVYGPPERPLQLNGGARLEFGDKRRFDVALSAQQISLDRILGGGPSEPVAIDDAMSTVASVIRWLPRPAMPGTLAFNADGLVAGGSVVQNISATLAPDDDGGWNVEEFAAALPGETTVAARGRLVAGNTPGFEGWGRITSERPAALAAWWRSQSGPAARIGPFAAEANVAFSAASRVADNIVATTGDGTVRGMVAARNFAASNDMFVTVELESDRFDLDRARALVEVLGGGLIGVGNVNRISIDLSADVLVAGGIEARAVTIEGDYEDEELDLRRLTVADLAGARVEARGRIRDLLDTPSGAFDATLKADSLAGTALFFAGVLPGNAAVEHFGRIAPALAPVDADLSIRAGEPDVGLAIDVGGNFAGTRISLRGTGSGRLSDPESLTGKIDGLFVGTDTAKVLAQIGLPVLPLPDLGPARLTVSLDGSLADGAGLNLQAEAAGTGLEFDGTARVIDASPALDGRLDVVSGNIDPLLLISGVALPGVGEGHPFTLSGNLRLRGSRAEIDIADAGFDREPIGGEVAITMGDPLSIKGALRLGSFSLPVAMAATTGALPERDEQGWSDRPFAAALPEGLAADLDIRARELDLGIGPVARDARLSLVHAGQTTDIDELEADFAGGRIEGGLSSRVRNGIIAFTLRARLEGVDLEDMVWQSNDRPVARGRLTASIDLNGGGRSLSGLVSTLGGTGALTITDGSIPALNPEAFTSIIRASDAQPDMEDEELDQVFAGYLDAGSLVFERASGSLSLAQGVLQLSTISFGTDTATALGSATFDLNHLTVHGIGTLKADVGPEKVTGSDPEIGLSFSGPLTDPKRSVDTGPLVGYLTVRAFERDVKRIEALQAEIAERERRLGLRPPELDAEEPGQGMSAEPPGGVEPSAAPIMLPAERDPDGPAEQGDATLGAGEASADGTTSAEPSEALPEGGQAAGQAAAAERPVPQARAEGAVLPPLDSVKRESLMTPASRRSAPSRANVGGPLQLLPETP